MTEKKPDHAPRYFIQDLTVVYGSKASEVPSGHVRDLNGLNADINAGFGGKYVWLVPEYITARTNAAVGWDVIIQPNEDKSLSDLAAGAGGDYRYLRPIQDITKDAKVTSVALLRLENPLSGVPNGWDGVTIDINKGRGGSYLYIIWKTSA